MNRHERSRTCGIDSQAWPMQIEDVRNAVCGSTVGVARTDVRIDLRIIIKQILIIVVAKSRDEDTTLAACDRIGGLSSLFQRLMSNFQQQALLRVQMISLTRRNIKEACVEQIDLFQESAPASRHLSGSSNIGIVIGIDIPALGWYFGDSIAPLLKQLPERGKVWGAGIATSHTNNSDRLCWVG